MSGFISRAVSRLIDNLQAVPQVAVFWQLIRSAQKDVYAIVIGDSTGNASDEWVKKWAVLLALDAPTHSVRYRLFVEGSGWAGEEVLSVGTGAKSIYIDNVSHPGSTERYMQGAKRAEIYNAARSYDLVIINHGHNEGTGTNDNTLTSGFTEAAVSVRQDNPRAAVCVTLQNTRTDAAEYSARLVALWREVAALHGFGVIDVYSVFQALGNPAGLYLDAIHPNGQGMDLWAQVARKALGSGAIAQGHVQPAPFNVHRINYAPNTCFNKWDVDKPAGWTLNNCTASRDLSRAETFAFSVALTTTNIASPNLFADLKSSLAMLRGQWVTVLARVWRATGVGSTAGRIQMSGTALAATTSRSKATEALDGWHWEAVHAFIPANETTLLVKVLASVINGETVHVDRLTVVIGMAPGEVDLLAQPAVDLDTYYLSTKVGKPAGFDGVLTVTGNAFTLTGNTTQARVYCNLAFMRPGETYRLTWANLNASTGDVVARAGENGGGSILATNPIETDFVLTWKATRTEECVMFSGDGTLALNIGSIVVTKL